MKNNEASMEKNLVEVERVKIINVGGSMYMKVPDCLKRKFAPIIGDSATFHRSSDEGDTIIRIEKTNEDH